MAALQLWLTGSSANLDFFRSSRDDLYVEVREDNLMRGADNKLVVRSTPQYEVRIFQYRCCCSEWAKTHVFLYKPKRNPPNNHVPDRTVTRLVRQQLETS